LHRFLDRVLALAWAVFALALSIPAGAEAQQAADPFRLEGELRIGEQPAEVGWVVLHQVTPEEAGAIDSVQVGPQGRFQLTLPAAPVEGSGIVFFATHRYEDILYFGPPISRLAEGELYRVQAWPRRVAPREGVSLPVVVRNLFVEEGPFGWRVTDLVEIRNDSAFSWVPDPNDPTSKVWSYPLPPGASSFRLGDGDPAFGAVTFEEGQVHLRAAVQPGERLLVFLYEVPSIEMSVPLPGQTGILEFLVRLPVGPLRVSGLQSAGPVEIERGVSYLRWYGEELRDLVVQVRPGEDKPFPFAWIAAGLGFLLAVSGAWLIRDRIRKGSSTPSPSGRNGGGPLPASASEATPFARRKALLLAVAQLDEEAEAASAQGESALERRERAQRRGVLLAELEVAETELRMDQAERARGSGANRQG